MSATAAPAAGLAGSEPQPGLAVPIIALGALASLASATVINVAIPELEVVFHAGLIDVQWLGTGYLLGLAAAIPAAGWLSDRVGSKALHLGALTLFALASLLCGLGRDLIVEIACRALQGVAGGLLLPVGMGMLVHLTPPAARARLIGVVATPMLLGAAFGPAVAGWLLVHLGWEYIFWVNIPICLLAIGLSSRWLHDTRRAARGPLDVVGLALAAPAGPLLVYGATAAAALGWASPVPAAAIAGGLLLAVAFVAWELRLENPLLDVRTLGDVAFASTMAVVGLLLVTISSATFVIAIYLRHFQAYDPAGAGLLVAFQGLGVAVAMPVGAWLTARHGARPSAFAGVCLLTAVGFVLATVNATTGSAQWAGLMLGLGSALGLCTMPALTVAYVTGAPERLARTNPLAGTIGPAAAALGIAIASIVFSSRLAARTPALPAGNGHLHQVLAGGAGLAIDDTLVLIAGASALALPVALLVRPPLPAGDGETTPRPRPGLIGAVVAAHVISRAIFVLALLLALA